MKTKVLTISKLKEFITEIFYVKQDKVTKVTDNSVINSLFYGMAKVGQKALVDIANIEGQLFPEYATGEILDLVAKRKGVPERFTACGSSVFLRVVGYPGTKYLASTHTFMSSNGVVFELSEDVEIPLDGYTYVGVRSRDIGVKTNVPPYSITTVSPVPSGHKYVINEFASIRGADIEDDDVFRQRIINFPNLISETTIEKINQIFIKHNNNVLRTIYRGLDVSGKNRLAILTQNGSLLSQTELDDLLSFVKDYISISDLREYGNNILGIVLENVEFYPIDVDIRVNFSQEYDPDLIRIDIQTKFAKKVDYRFWNDGDIVQWDDLLGIVKNTPGVKSVSDKYFYPHADIEIPDGQFPRFRGFILRDMDGNIWVDKSGNLDPVYFSNSLNFLDKIL